jgi:hypothetical protein
MLTSNHLFTIRQCDNVLIRVGDYTIGGRQVQMILPKKNKICSFIIYTQIDYCYLWLGSSFRFHFILCICLYKIR